MITTKALVKTVQCNLKFDDFLEKLDKCIELLDRYKEILDKFHFVSVQYLLIATRTTGYLSNRTPYSSNATWNSSNSSRNSSGSTLCLSNSSLNLSNIKAYLSHENCRSTVFTRHVFIDAMISLAKIIGHAVQWLYPPLSPPKRGDSHSSTQRESYPPGEEGYPKSGCGVRS